MRLLLTKADMVSGVEYAGFRPDTPLQIEI